MKWVLLPILLVFPAAIVQGFSSSFDDFVPGEILPGWGACPACDLGSSSPSRFSPESRPLPISEEGISFPLNNTGSVVASFDLDSLQPHRISFSYKADMVDTGSEGGYISFSYGERGGICEFGFVIRREGIYLDKIPEGEVREWDFSVQEEGGWSHVSLETGPCQEAQSKGIFLISVTSIPNDWGTLLVDDIMVE